MLITGIRCFDILPSSIYNTSYGSWYYHFQLILSQLIENYIIYSKQSQKYILNRGLMMWKLHQAKQIIFDISCRVFNEDQSYSIPEAKWTPFFKIRSDNLVGIVHSSSWLFWQGRCMQFIFILKYCKANNEARTLNRYIFLKQWLMICVKYFNIWRHAATIEW